MNIKGFIETSLLDWDGKISSVIFVGGCNFCCPFCHNSTLVKDYRHLPDIPIERILQYLNQRRQWIDGVVISGGEPCLYEDLGELIKEIKKLNLLVKIDTNGSRPQILEQLINDKLVDAVSMDIKAPLNASYEKATGCKADLEALKKSIKTLISSGIEYEFRTTMVPTLLTKDDIVKIVLEIKEAQKFVLQQFNTHQTLDAEFSKLKPYSPDYLQSTLLECKKYLSNCQIRN